MIWKGFRFGMLLQLAVGPMCILVFNTSATHGLFQGISLVLAITLVDLIFITLSCLGIGALMKRDSIKNGLKIFGSLVLVLFGINMIASALHHPLFPGISLFTSSNEKSIFLQGLLLTASNPLTIIFWSGVFSTQIMEHSYTKKQLSFFAIGCILSTLFFLTMVSILGTMISAFLSKAIMEIFNILVGCVIVYFGLKVLARRVPA